MSKICYGTVKHRCALNVVIKSQRLRVIFQKFNASRYALKFLRYLKLSVIVFYMLSQFFNEKRGSIL